MTEHIGSEDPEVLEAATGLSALRLLFGCILILIAFIAIFEEGSDLIHTGSAKPEADFATLLKQSKKLIVSPKKRFVVLVSWDGAKPSVLLQLMKKRGRMRTLKKLLQHGTWNFKAKTVHPSLTLPSHLSMLTGMTPEKHKVRWNSFRKDKAEITIPTAFSMLRKTGHRVAAVYTKSKLHHAFPSHALSDGERHYVRGNAWKVVKTAVRVFLQELPDLMFVHFPDPDTAGHRFGWGSLNDKKESSQPYQKALYRTDLATQYLIYAMKKRGIWDRSLFILTSDHGGTHFHHGAFSTENHEIPWLASGGLVSRRGLIKESVSTMDTAPTILSAFGLSFAKKRDGKVIRLIKSPTSKPTSKKASPKPTSKKSN